MKDVADGANVERELKIQITLDELEKAITNLRDTAYSLGGRLEAVLSEQTEKAEEYVLEPLHCPMANILNERNDSIRQVIAYLNDLKRRLEI